MNKNKINTSKTMVSAIVLIVVVLLCLYPAYYINSKIRNYKTEVLGEYTKLAELESEKNVLDIYNRILLKGSKESVEIEKYVLSGNRKDVLALVNEIEQYAKKVGLIESGSALVQSVSTRENAQLTKLNASDLVISMKVSGTEKSVENFIELLKNLPLVSYIEKMEIRFDSATGKTSGSLILVIYQKK